MEGKTKPAQLLKIGGALFKRISERLGAEDGLTKLQKTWVDNSNTAEATHVGKAQYRFLTMTPREKMTATTS